MVRSGDMRHVVELQVRSTVQDAAGERANVWNVFTKRRAAIMRTPGNEVFASAQRAGRVPVVVKMRWLAGVTTSMRLLFRCGCCSGKGVHEVKSAIDEAGRNEELVVTAEEHPEEAP